MKAWTSLFIVKMGYDVVVIEVDVAYTPLILLSVRAQIKVWALLHDLGHEVSSSHPSSPLCHRTWKYLNSLRSWLHDNWYHNADQGLNSAQSNLLYLGLWKCSPCLSCLAMRAKTRTQAVSQKSTWIIASHNSTESNAICLQKSPDSPVNRSLVGKKVIEPSSCLYSWIVLSTCTEYFFREVDRALSLDSTHSVHSRDYNAFDISWTLPGLYIRPTTSKQCGCCSSRYDHASCVQVCDSAPYIDRLHLMCLL